MLNTGAFKRNLLAKRNVVHLRPSREELEKSREEENTNKFFDNQFWKEPVNESELDAMLREEGLLV